MIDPKKLEPSTDAGSESFARFRYQAEVTFPFCLQCALGNEIVSVIPEHIEDIAIEYENHWRFLQVKSRNPERGLWKLSDLLGDGGALRTLFRTHQQTIDVQATLEILLEGASKPGDLIESLHYGKDHRDAELIDKVSRTFQIQADEATRFLDRITLLAPSVPRPNIKDHNIHLLHEHNVSLDHSTVSDIHSNLSREIERAMAAEPIGPSWPRYVTHPDQTPSDISERFTAKRLTKPYLRNLVSPITSSPRHLLRQITDPRSNVISILSRKLIAGGATEDMVNKARTLRANAQLRWINIQTSSLFSREDVLEDLHQRLETHVVAKKALYAPSPKPAIEIWDALLTQFSTNPTVIDPHQLMQADPMLLLGQVCELAELCRVDWGIASAD